MPQRKTVRPASFEEGAATLSEWARTHVKQIAIGAVFVLGVVGGVYLYREASEAKERNAARQLSSAAGSLQSNNIPLATRDLEQLVTRFEGTRSAQEGALILTQLLYEQGRYQDGINRIEPLTRSEEPHIAASAHNLVGAGYEQLSQFPKAAESYQKAAETTKFPNEKAAYLASAARAYGGAGNLAEAKKIWTQLAEDPRTPAATSSEARVRLGEINAQLATRG
ncbi:MAG TPA: tetratricopeptide repeat protein [Gemmatimonadaceae bacterium]|nr:tetratricopeptide repeat protein [Gemmatimonadaceae bacterium]